MRHRGKLASLIVALVAAAGCQDSYSQRRIHMRQENLRTLADDISQSEKRKAAEIKDVGETLKKWWRSDTERFNRKSPTVGDYFF